jgi:UPF0755 protein
MTDDWLDPRDAEDSAAREREQRRREREARRRQRLGQRVEEAAAAGDQPAAPADDGDRLTPVEDDGDRLPPAEDDFWSDEPEPTLPPLPPLPSEAARPSRRTIRRRRIVFGALFLVLALLAAFLVLLFQPFHGAGHGKVQVRIPKGASASDIADLLDSKGVVASSFFFRIRLDLSGKSGDIQAGRYTLASGMSYGGAIDSLTTKVKPVKPKTVTVTIPEGYDRLQTADLLKQDGVDGSYTAASRSFKGFDPARYGAKNPANLEGFLFPATYKLKPKQDANDLVAQQLAAFQQNIKRVKMKYARSKNLTTYDVVTIASIVQREAGVTGDYPKVAAVVYNRLHDGMPLQVDATIRFAEHNYTKPLTNADLHLNSPYNTYDNMGLPPGPISNPGLAALRAAAHPAHVPYLYYVTKPGACGQLSFAANYRHFLRLQNAYNNARAAAGGKSPTKC